VHHLDPQPGEVFTWGKLLAKTGVTPDVVVVGDKSIPPFLVGMERFPCLTVFYAVDTHIHSWYPWYAQGFDVVLVSLKDHMPLFHKRRLRPEDIWWSPPYAGDTDAPKPPDPAKPIWDLLFVGTVDENINPRRLAFMRELAALFPGLHTQRGLYPELFPQGRLILNHAAQEDLNFRVFEALGCGSVLLTPRVGHGLVELFQDEKELFLYDQGDIPGLVALARHLLAQPELRAAVAAAGLAAVDAKHRAHHRAERFTTDMLALFSDGTAEERVRRRREEAPSIHARYLRLLYLLHADTIPSPSMKAAYLAAAGGSHTD
jgi:hypothetical protein